MRPFSASKDYIITLIGLSLGYRHRYHPPPYLVAVYLKLLPGAYDAAAHQRDCNPFPAANAVGHCCHLRLPLRQNAGVVDQVTHAGIIAGVHHTVVTPTNYIALSQVMGSAKAVTNTVGFRSLIALRADLSLIVTLLPLVCMTCQWKLDNSTSLCSTTVMCPMPLAANNRRRVGPITPDLTTRTDDDRSLRWTNTPNPSESRSCWEYCKIW